jgi:threonine aldolase
MKIDLRSDTVTTPTPAMRKAMAAAEVGDDVYGEDPTVNRLQEMLAERTGFEVGLLLPSGTMSNLVALNAHAERGHEVIAPEGAHVYESELGGLAVVAGLIPRLVPAPWGVPEVIDVKRAIRRSPHVAPPGLIALENTHNYAGGTVVPVERCKEVAALAREENLPIHLDGARVFNAAAAQAVDVAEVCAPFDTVSICLSKGLGAPVGTVLLGSADFIARAHRYRKILGGGMRQAGVIAAAGVVALETMVERLPEDHMRARWLAERVHALPGVSLDLTTAQTNMVRFEIDDAPGLVQEMAALGVRANARGSSVVRLVTHHQITDEQLERASTVIAELIERRAKVEA